MRKLLFLMMIAAWAMLGCSSEKTDSASVAHAGEPTAEDAAGRELNKPDRELAMAEARRESQRMAKPAVSTAELSDAPAWQLRDLEGATVTSADFAGKVVILDFWATWCGPCKMEIPHFKELQAAYGDKGLEIIGVALDREGKRKVEPFIKQAGVNYTTVLGNQKIVTDYAPIQGIPTTFVISQDGKIFKRYVGFRPKEIFEDDVKTLLGLES